MYKIPYPFTTTLKHLHGVEQTTYKTLKPTCAWVFTIFKTPHTIEMGKYLLLFIYLKYRSINYFLKRSYIDL